MVVIGKKEKAQTESLLPQLSEDIQRIYRDTEVGNEQRWFMIPLTGDNTVYQDVLKLIRIRRERK